MVANISCCSTVDLTPELLEQRGIRYAHFHYLLDHKEYDDDMGKTISMEDFYKAMVGGADAHTAQINVEEYCRYFTPFLEAVLVVLPRLVNRTKIGMDMRAASWNFEATQLMASRSTTSSALHPTVLYSFLPA